MYKFEREKPVSKVILFTSKNNVQIDVHQSELKRFVSILVEENLTPHGEMGDLQVGID